MKDVFRDPQVKEFLKQFESDGLPALMGSRVMLAIMAPEPDAKMCLEIGAAVLLDKPIILCVPKGVRLPENLRKCTTKIVYINAKGEEMSPEMQGQIEDALYDVTRSIDPNDPES